MLLLPLTLLKGHLSLKKSNSTLYTAGKGPELQSQGLYGPQMLVSEELTNLLFTNTV